MKSNVVAAIFCCLLFSCLNSLAQKRQLQEQLVKLANYSDSLINHFPPEKVCIQFDKPDYMTGDTVWFKAWLLNAPTLMLSAQSGLLHIDIADDSSKVVKEYLLQVTNGLARGQLVLQPKLFKDGHYTLRAYTNWMRNFGDATFFHKPIRVADANENNWLVNSNITKVLENPTVIKTLAQLTSVDKIPLSDSLLQVRILDGNKSLFRQNIKADKNGRLDFQFTLPKNRNVSSIEIQNHARNRKAVIPVNIDNDIDLQFMPESGNLVGELSSVVGFKAIGKDGNGVDIHGTILDKEGRTIASFSSFNKGMGSFPLRSQPGESYTARVDIGAGNIKSFSLPTVKESGMVLHVSNGMRADSVEVFLTASEDIIKSNQPYFLVGKSRGIICYAAVADLAKGGVVKQQIAKGLFPTGIAHFILTTSQGVPVCERSTYINHHDNLQISIQPDHPYYAAKDSVSLHFTVTDASGRPVAGNFAMAVTDDGQVHADSSDNILCYSLLTSDLKGYVENPAYYLVNDTTSWRALDNLLLTQGWVTYEPPPGHLAYPAEKEYAVSGKVINVFNTPVKKTDVLLFSNHPPILMDTLTDGKGKFTFNHFPRVDTPVFMLQARNRHGKSFNVGISVDQVIPPKFVAPSVPVVTPWYLNSDSVVLTQVKDKITAAKFDYDNPGAHHLKEVKITAHKIVKGSENLNGPGNSDIVLDEKDVEAAGKKSWLQMLQETIPGFREGLLCVGGYAPKCAKDTKLFNFLIDNTTGDDSKMSQTWYFVKDKPIKIIIDGVPLFKMVPLGNEPIVFPEFSNFLKSHNAEEIKGIEINSSTKYTYRYVPMEWSMAIQPNDVAFIEITTRSGHGAVLKSTPGTYLYKPQALSWPKQFYKPRYTVSDTTKRIDLRPTIDWEPNITTDAEGKATVSFYAGTEPAEYTVIVEGTDGNGGLGSQRKKISIVRKSNMAKSK